MNHTVGFDVPQTIRKSFEMSDFDGRDYLLNQVAHGGILSYEHPIPSLLIAYLSRNPGTFLDVGANTGLYTLLAAAISRDVEVCAFEPLADIWAKLKSNVDLNPSLAPRIRCIQTALSHTSGRAAFFETVNDMGFLTTSSSLEESHARAVTSQYVVGEVELQTLDGWMENSSVSNPTLVKIDVEGHEAGVVKGADRFFSDHRPLVFIEMLAGADFEYFDRFLTAKHYLNFEIEAFRTTLAPKVRFAPLAWNHALCPAEKIYPFVLAARQAGLEIA